MKKLTAIITILAATAGFSLAEPLVPLQINRLFWIGVPSYMSFSENTAQFMSLTCFNSQNDFTLITVMNEVWSDPVPNRLMTIGEAGELATKKQAEPNILQAFVSPFTAFGKPAVFKEYITSRPDININSVSFVAIFFTNGYRYQLKVETNETLSREWRIIFWQMVQSLRLDASNNQALTKNS